MATINYTITLTSDAEPASGFGTDLIDSLLPRDDKGRVILPSSHIKGIIRENLENFPVKIIPSHVIAALFGKAGSSNALFHINNAVAPDKAKILAITRTSLNEFGIAHKGSLRSSEAVASGTQFSGTVITAPNLSEPYKDLLKLGLLSLFAVGGGRNRGAGSCFVTLTKGHQTPGKILKHLAATDFDKIPALTPVKTRRLDISDRQVTLKLIFKATSPVCVPEVPVVRNNMIRSGFSIPASAVQGAILHRVNDISKPVADACYASKNFRAWPLHPSNSKQSFSLRTSFTHKISKSKIPGTGNYHFEDEAIAAFNSNTSPVTSPLVSTEGVLLADDTCVKFWKSSEMARIISAHGVHNGNRESIETTRKRNLFTVESLAPTLFTGMISIPETACDLLLESLEKNSFIRMGKSRSVRGGGELSAEKLEFTELPIMKNQKANIFIVQSPVCVPQKLEKESLETIMSVLVEESGFGRMEKIWGAMATQFGWNSTIQKGRLGSKTVITPGTVFKLESPVNNLLEKLISGIGMKRENGFGAVLPHPGVAIQLFSPRPEKREVPKVSQNFGEDGFKLCKKAKASRLSASQISKVRELVIRDKKKAVAYLERQRRDRPDKIWERWRKVFLEIKNGIEKDSEHMAKVLKVCQDLLAADKGKK